MTENNAVFAWIWCISQPYKDYTDADTNHNERVVEILVTCRYDNSFGAIGGKADEGEGLMAALYREFEEETGANFNFLPVEFKPMFSYNYDNQRIHTYHCEVSEEDMKLIVSMTPNATHYRAESCGLIRLRFPLSGLLGGEAFENAYNLPWVAAANEELTELLYTIYEMNQEGVLV